MSREDRTATLGRCPRLRTLAAAALFSLVRRRAQRRVDRRFNRARYDADQTVAAFAARAGTRSWDPDFLDLDRAVLAQRQCAGLGHPASLDRIQDRAR